MSDYPAEFLFFSDTGPAVPRGWRETLAVIKNPQDRSASNALLRLMVSFASEFMLEGNVWQYWLTYMLMMHENAFTLSCERETIEPESTLMKLAESDFELFQSLFSEDLHQMGALSLMVNYSGSAVPGERNHAGKTIKRLCGDLCQSDSLQDFIRNLSVYYSQYGIGMFGLYKAFRISDGDKSLNLIPVADCPDVSFDDLIGLEEQKKTLRRNTEAFVNGLNANNVLLYGDSGTGKSTSVHALMYDYYDRGLRLVELSKQDRKLLPKVLAAIKKRNYHFIIYLDDLSFEENESDYKELKAMLEGALEKRSDRVLIYATSNRRHLIRETWTDRNDMEYENDIHRSDTMEEKLSLASRFGVTVYYSKPNPDEYMEIVQALAARNGIQLSEKELNNRARKWELRHGGMSGRTASQLITWLSGENNE